MTNEQLQKTVLIRELLDGAKNRHYVVDKSVMESYVKRYVNLEESKQLYNFAIDHYGMTSDCYILYALCLLGVADNKTIYRFLCALSSKYKELQISFGEEGFVVERMRILYKNGLICRFIYDAPKGINDEKNQKETVALFVAAPKAHDIVRQALRLVLPENKGVEFKHISEIAGWACGARVGVEIAYRSSHFVDYLQRHLKTRQLGSVFFPCEVLTEVNGVKYYISILDCYLGMNGEIQTPRMYAEYCGRKIDTIKNYINCRTTKGVPIVVCAVRDNSDLNEMATKICQTGALNGMYENVYFTGEGPLISGLEAKDCFLQMKENSLSEKGYELFHAEPVFL